MQRATRALMDRLEKVLGPMRDIMASDMGSGQAEMAWLMDEYGRLHGHTPAIVTGKPVELAREVAGDIGMAHREVRDRAAADGCSLRQAACRVAMTRVARAVRLRDDV